MDKLHQLIQQWLWPKALPASKLAAAPIVVARYAYALARELMAGDLNLRAMSLVYTTILAVVPLLAFSFSLLKGLGFHRQLEPLLFSFLEPIGPQARVITDNVIQFVDNVSGSVLAAASMAVFLYTALSMAQKVEESFNFVWRVDRPRSFGRRVSEYLTVILLGPLAMSVVIALMATISSTTLVERLAEIGPLGRLITEISDLTPFVVLMFAFTFLYVIVPNAKVRILPAVGGGIFAGIAWAACGEMFTRSVTMTARYEAIYSGFAIVLIVMIWLYLSWLILLIGAQLAFYLQQPEYLRLGRHRPPMSNSLSERLALSVMLLVGRDFDRPEHGWGESGLAGRLRVPRHWLHPIMVALRNAKLLTETTDQRLIPARDPRHIQLFEILDAVRQSSKDDVPDGASDVSPAILALHEGIERGIRSAVAGRSLADLVDEDLAADTNTDTGAASKPVSISDAQR